MTSSGDPRDDAWVDVVRAGVTRVGVMPIDVTRTRTRRAISRWSMSAATMRAMRLWGGCFGEASDPRVAEFTRSIERDREVALDDLVGSIAHPHGLGRAGLLTPPRSRRSWPAWAAFERRSRPATSHGTRSSRTSTCTSRRRSGQVPDAMVGMALGASGDATTAALAPDPGIGDVPRAAAGLEAALASCDVAGGTAPGQVRTALAAAGARLDREALAGG